MINIKSIKELSLAELKMESKIMADILNKRLRRLEKEGLASSSVFYSYVTKYARQGKEFIDYTKKGQVKYITGFKKYNRTEMINIYKNLKAGMVSTTSTVKGTKQAVRKKAQSMQDLFGEVLDMMNMVDVNDLFKYARESGFLRTYGSDTVEKMLDKNRMINEVRERMEKINDITVRTAKGQLPNSQVINSMSLSDKEFNEWVNKTQKKQDNYLEKKVQRQAERALMTEEEKQFEELEKATKRTARKQIAEESNIANINKNLNKNINNNVLTKKKANTTKKKKK